MILQDANVVIIGGSTGIGFAMAKLAIEQGANVTIAGRSHEKLQRAAGQLCKGQTIVADIALESDIQALFGGMERVDHVFVSAGRPLFGKILETDLATFRSDADQRFWGLLYVVRNAAPKMRQGSITVITGLYASVPGVGAVVTSALQSTQETMVKGLALELSPIRVNAIAPGPIDTPFVGEEGREGMRRWAKENLPVGRIGTAEEVAQAALLLMTNGFITGEVLHIDGGGRLI